MQMTNRLLMAAVMFLLLGGTPALADEKTPAPTSAPTGAKPGGSEREKAAAPTREKAPAGRDIKSSEKPEAEKAKDKDKDGPKAAAVHKVMQEEANYRKQMAKIDRLRELAKAKGDQNRLAQLDKMEAKITEHHQRKVEQAKAKLDKEQAKALDDKLKHGREHAKHEKHDKDDKARHDKDAEHNKDKSNAGEHSKTEKKPEAPPAPKRGEEKPKQPEKDKDKDKNGRGGKPGFFSLIGGAA